jgi:hypothetical protein
MIQENYPGQRKKSPQDTPASTFPNVSNVSNVSQFKRRKHHEFPIQPKSSQAKNGSELPHGV